MRFLPIGPPSILTILGILCLPQSSTIAEPGNSKLTQTDREYLDSLFREFLFDPTGAERIRVKMPDRRLGAWSESELTARDGWLVKGTKGEPDRVFFMDGCAIAAPPADRIERVDFLAPIERFFKSRQPPEADTGEWVQKTAKEVLGGTDCFLPYAAWLYRLGHDDYAAQALGLARALTGNDPKNDLREALSRTAFDEMHDAFCTRADAEALVRGEHFLRVFAGTDKGRRKPQAEAIMADLKRRREQGAFGKIPDKDWPPGFSNWAAAKKLAYLLACLDDLADSGFVGSYYQPFLNDRHVIALIELGEMAVPGLIDVIEKDPRLTRCPVRGYKFGEPTGQFHGVGDAAEVAVKSILRVQRFPEVAREGDVANVQAFRIRKYWDTYGKLPFGERMMTILTDEKAPEDSWREAAANLAKWDHPRRFGLSGGWSELPPSEPRKPNPFVPKFNNPTVAEAIVAAMDRDWAIQQGRGPQNGAFHAWPETELEYLQYLVELSDGRIASELDRRARTAGDSDVRRIYSFAASRLGTSGEWIKFTRAVERGEVPLESAATANTTFGDHSREEEELTRIISALVRSGSPESEKAIVALIDSAHPYFEDVRKLTMNPITAWGERESPWSSHPTFLKVLQRGLQDRSATGARHEVKIGDSGLVTSSINNHRTRFISAADWASGSFRDSVDERVCDLAASRLSGMVAGLPGYDPLEKVSDEQLAAIRATLNRYGGHVRPMNWNERNRIDMGFSEPGFIPDIGPLGRPATAGDLTTGHAVFEFGGKGRVADVKLPAWLLLKTEAKKEHPAFGLVVQAEAGANGKVVYGAIFRHSIRAVRADEVEWIEPYTNK